jgi:glycosyltransferase involved in cell wall biosynthesis
MRIVLLTETFSDQMGYLENTLPRYLAQFGADVHVISADLPPYYQLKDFNQTYKDFDTGSDSRRPGTVRKLNGFRVHFVGHQRVLGYVRMLGLREKLKELRPQVVQTTAAVGWLPLDAALFKPLFGYKLFTGNSTTASVFPLAQRDHHLWDPERVRAIATRTLPGFFISLLTTKCYPSTVDCADVAARFLGVPRRMMQVAPLGVDTDLFSPVSDQAQLQDRLELRRKFGFADDQIICIYTGRFTTDKNPLLLAKAIDKLATADEPYRGLFVGNGVQLEEIQKCRNCTVHHFVPVTELARYFRASDIGVWPTQESMSMLDAAACGLPIVVNDTLRAVERIEGNGLTYRLGDADDLVRVLLSLKSREVRDRLGQRGADKMRTQFGWESIARQRMHEYAQYVKG